MQVESSIKTSKIFAFPIKTLSGADVMITIGRNATKTKPEILLNISGGYLDIPETSYIKLMRFDNSGIQISSVATKNHTQ